MKEVCIITNKYPNKLEENTLVFLQQLVWEMADQNIKCTVICPVPININPKYLKLPYQIKETTENGSEITVYFPKYIGFGQTPIFGYNPTKITTNRFTKTVEKTIKNLPNYPDVLYSHFVTPAGIAAARLGNKFNIPSYIAYGESTPWSITNFGVNDIKKELETIDGIIAVSTHNKNELLSLGVVDESKIGVFPNGVREERFYPRDKSESRGKFNLPKDKFIVSFVGSFDHRKGIERLIEAVESLDNVYVICAGKGKLTPDSERCLYHGSVNHKDLPYFYSASDVFVLPTLYEGCANVLIEAMACGVPIVSSNLPFNDDILDSSNSFRINPMNIIEISTSIRKIKASNRLKNELSKGSIKKSKMLTLKKRTQNILQYIQSNLQK